MSTTRSLRASLPLVSLALASLLVCCAKPAAQHAAPPSPAELMQRGIFLADQGDDFAAEQYFDAARSAGYPEPAVIRELVSVCIQAGRLEQALAHAEAYIERSPDDWVLRHVIATIQFAKGEPEAARRELELLLSEHPEHAESQFLLGVVLRDALADVAGARAAFEHYLALSPQGEHASEARTFLRRSQRATPTLRRRASP
jgi:predicted Zn-dependent protease